MAAYNKGHISTAIDTIEPTFSSADYTNWKYAFVKKIGFAAHEQSNCHKHALMCVVTILATTREGDELINRKYAEEKAVLHQFLLKSCRTVFFLQRRLIRCEVMVKGSSL